MESLLLIEQKTVNIDSIAIERQELPWEERFTDEGSVYHSYYNKAHDFETDDYRIECELNASMMDYEVECVWVGKIKLWSDDGLVELDDEQEERLRNKIEKLYK